VLAQDTWPVFVGIDVACAKRKSLPICFAALDEGRLTPLELPRSIRSVFPVGTGNREIEERCPFRAHAKILSAAFDAIEAECGWSIVEVAIDAPAAPPRIGVRRSELALGDKGFSCYRTPKESQWVEIHKACRQHLQDGKPLNRLPYANMVWMLYGFEIFKILRQRRGTKVIEVYPQAIIQSLLREPCPHKSTDEGYRRQLRVMAEKTDWSPSDLEIALAKTVPGTRHDRLDAFMSAWVASLGSTQRSAFGRVEDADDSIWVPQVTAS
jgi:predicted nuclease with RNAse H fold